MPHRVLCVALVAICLTVSGFAQQSKPQESVINGHTMHTLLKPGDIPAIFDPKFVTVEKAGELYYDDEPLMVVFDSEGARGYSTWHLDRHEIVNDVIAGRPIAVTW